MKIVKLICCILFYLLTILSPKAQSKNDIQRTGIVTGKAMDSVYNFVLSSASVAVYQAADSSLINFSLPNEFGEFTVDKLPIGTKLQLVITHTGFKSFTGYFRIPPEKRTYDFGWVYMNQQNLDESDSNTVVVTTIKKAPMRMNGDTVEFNADAFKIDSNATAEDLMRRLPGFTIWGDGDITFNGKKINAVYMDGKPFLGGTDVTALTQNLPKNAIDKIQVYQQRNDKNPLDSMLFANIKLKEDKKMGYFGKISSGWGTDKHYALDGMLTGFNKKIQTSVVGSMNDINRMAYNTDALIKYSSYKGVGANTDYQSDFSMGGLNKPKAIGGKFQYDFIEDVEYQKSSRLNANAFYRRNDQYLIRDRQSNTMLGNDSLLSSNSNNLQNSTSEDGTFNSVFARSSQHYSLNINAGWQYDHNSNHSEGITEQSRTGSGMISTSNSLTETFNQSNIFNGGFSYTHNDNADYSYDPQDRKLPTNFTLEYNIRVNNSNGSSRNKTSFRSLVTTVEDQDYDRLYAQRDGNTVDHEINFSYPNLKDLLFGRNYMAGIQMTLSNNILLTHATHNDVVLDFNSETQQYTRNQYLSNNRKQDITNEMPSIGFSKTIYKGLTNRYSKSFSLNFSGRAQYYKMTNSATQAVQNLGYQYWMFVPTASISYYNHQYGSYEVNSNLGWQERAGYPMLGNLAPLIDSSQLYYIHVGNRALTPEKNSSFNFSFEIKSRTPKNPIQLTFNAGYTTTKNNIGDSTIINTSGQSIVYNVNLDGSRNLNGGANLRKSVEFNKNTFQINLGYNYYFDRTLGYYNSTFNISKSTTNSGNVHIDYSYLDIVTLRAEQSLYYNKAIQHGYNDSKFKSNNSYTRFSGALQLPKNWVWSTNITYNRNQADNTQTIHYTIWNASLTYRFLKGNRGEVKFSAMDMLHQNKGITNTARYNNQTLTSTNVLQQYYMLTISYFPRKFGK